MATGGPPVVHHWQMDKRVVGHHRQTVAFGGGPPVAHHYVAFLVKTLLKHFFLIQKGFTHNVSQKHLKTLLKHFTGMLKMFQKCFCKFGD